jgi:CubicO group peptidase (beta-lactamase class C family)
VACAGAAARFGDGGPLDSPVPLTTATALDLGSVTKVLATTSALMALVDDGAVRLDDRLGDLLPAAAGTPVAGATLADLLEHRAGLWEWWPLYLTAQGPEAIELIGRLPLRYSRAPVGTIPTSVSSCSATWWRGSPNGPCPKRCATWRYDRSA